MSIRFGYACLARGVPGTELRSCTLRTVSPEKLREITAHNLCALERLIDYNIKNRIPLFRISSDLIPFGSGPVNTICWQVEFAQDFHRIGKKISDAGMRVSMHPGQYTVLNSPNPDVVRRAIADLNYHEQVLNLLGTDCSSKIILHVGGVYGEREASVRRFTQNWPLLGRGIRDRVVLENDERSYDIAEVLCLAEQVGVPAVFDTLHHSIHHPQKEKPLRFWAKQCAETWIQSDGRQKIHYSQQEPGGRPGAHSQTIHMREFLRFFENVEDLDLDIMLEVKDKNISAVKCTLLTDQSCSIAMLEQEWDKYQYAVLEHSHNDYLAAQKVLQEKEGQPVCRFYAILEHALSLPVQPADTGNALTGLHKSVKRKNFCLH